MDLLSLITVMVSGAALETSIVGREGGVGFVEALGSGAMFSRVIVQIPGQAYRLRVWLTGALSKTASHAGEGGERT